jgi:hypothetical protein
VEKSTHEYELSNHINTIYNTFAFARFLRTGAFYIFKNFYVKKWQFLLMAAYGMGIRAGIGLNQMWNFEKIRLKAICAMTNK